MTTFRIPTKDRVFTEELTYKGMTIRVGGWVHLMNPDDPAKPIIAQVFKTWVPDGWVLFAQVWGLKFLSVNRKKGQQGLTACWYFRPEQVSISKKIRLLVFTSAQTVHPPHRQFWEGEVFKTG